MSNALAIAAVTAVLIDLLNNGLIDATANGGIGSPVAVSAKAPDRVFGQEAEKAQLNLFLYHVAPNPGWRNTGLPARDPAGERVSNPPLALDLTYLLTAYGGKDLEAEILLGYAMQLLHETPTLPRTTIRKALSQSGMFGSVFLPGGVSLLSSAQLADQVEQIKLTLQPLSTDEMSKLWSAFQAKYRPSVAYQASVVLIESQRPARSPLPVLTRGHRDQGTGRDEGVIVQPSLLPPFPTLQAVVPPNEQPALRMGETLTLQGHHLAGDQIRARFTHVRSASTLDLPVAANGPGADTVHVRLPADTKPKGVAPESPENPDNWQAGFYSLALIGKRVADGQETEWMTNELPVVLAPTMMNIGHNVVGETVTLSVTCAPKVGKMQRVTLVVGTRELSAEPIVDEQSAEVVFQAPRAHLPKGKQWLRLRVDGAESLLVKRSRLQPEFDDTQQVTL